MKKNRYRAAEPAYFRTQEHSYNVAQQHASGVKRAEGDKKTGQAHSRLGEEPFAAPDVGDDPGHAD